MLAVSCFSYLVEFSDYLLREKLLEEVPEFKSINGHNLCTPSLPLVPENGNENDLSSNA